MRVNIGSSEGTICNAYGCDGVIQLERDRICSCHINPPCRACIEAKLVCGKCGREVKL